MLMLQGSDRGGMTGDHAAQNVWRQENGKTLALWDSTEKSLLQYRSRLKIPAYLPYSVDLQH